MATNLLPLSPIPVPSQPIVNPKTGLIDKDWYAYFRAVDTHIRDIERRLTAGGL